MNFAHNDEANARRLDKAKKLARALYDSGVSTSAVVLLGADDRKAWLKTAELRTSNPIELWDIVVELLAAREEWDAAQPTLEPVTVEAAPKPAAAPVKLNENLSFPPGWDALVALGPLDFPKAKCHKCRAQAVVGTPTGWRCADHPPVGMEWGTKLSWAPRQTAGYCAPNRCYCGRCPAYEPVPATANQPTASGSQHARTMLAGQRRNASRSGKAPRGTSGAKQTLVSA